jgi:hypothetical protein
VTLTISILLTICDAGCMLVVSLYYLHIYTVTNSLVFISIIITQGVQVTSSSMRCSLWKRPSISMHYLE